MFISNLTRWRGILINTREINPMDLICPSYEHWDWNKNKKQKTEGHNEPHPDKGSAITFPI